LLDAAAYGMNVVEREGISLSHPSQFILIGTMNPAEGELRPQLSDRIGLHIVAHSIIDIKDRVEIMARREEFESDSEAFVNKFREEQQKILENVLSARKLLKDVNASSEIMKAIAHVSVNVGVDGHRADIAILKTAKTIAAYNKHVEVNYDDLKEALLLVLGERLPKTFDQNKIKQMMEKAISDTAEEEKDQSGQEQQDNANGESTPSDEDQQSDSDKDQSGGNGDNNENGDLTPEEKEHDEKQNRSVNISPGHVEQSEDQKKGMKLQIKKDEKGSADTDNEKIDIKKLLKMKGATKNRLYGKRVDSKTQKGKYIKSKFPKNGNQDIAIDATLRAAAIRSNGRIKVENEDIRQKVRKHCARASIALVVDVSGSMFSQRKANKVKGILNQLIDDTARHKDRISIIGFKGQGAEVIVPTTRRAVSFKEHVDNIRVGGTTPLASGIEKGFEVLKKEKIKREYVPIMMILTDGMPNVGIKECPTRDAINAAKNLKENNINTIVVNFEKSVKYGRSTNMEIALASGGRYYDLEDIKDAKKAVSQIIEYERSFF